MILQSSTITHWSCINLTRVDPSWPELTRVDPSWPEGEKVVRYRLTQRVCWRRGCVGAPYGSSWSCRRVWRCVRNCWSWWAGRAGRTTWRSGPGAATGSWKCPARSSGTPRTNGWTTRNLSGHYSIISRPLQHGPFPILPILSSYGETK